MNVVTRRGSRLGRWTLVTVVVLVVLAAVAYGLDRISRAAAETVVSDAIENGRPAPSSADVGIRGMFFIPQVVNGHYPHVHVRVQGISDQGLTVSRIDADLYDVDVPLSQVVRQDVTAIPVDHSREQALITYQSLNAYLKQQGQPVTVTNGSGDQLRLQGHLTALGREFTLSADATVKPGHSYIDVIPTQLHTGSSIVDAASAVLLKVRLAFRIPTSPLPFGQEVQSIRANGDGLVVVATGQHIVLYR